MNTKERGFSRCRTRKCDSLESPRQSSPRSGKGQTARTDKIGDDDHKRKPQKHPRRSNERGSSMNLMSQTLLSVAEKLEKVFNNSSSKPHSKVKRVYVIRFDNRKSDAKNRHKRYTRIIYDKKPVAGDRFCEMMRSSSNGCPENSSDGVTMHSHTTPDSGISGDYEDSSQDNSCIYMGDDKVQRMADIISNNDEREGETLGFDRYTEDKRAYQKIPNGGTKDQEECPRVEPNDRLSNVFEAILQEVQTLSSRKKNWYQAPKKKTLKEVIESNQPLTTADYTIPPSMVNEEAVEILQALINNKRKAQRNQDWRGSMPRLSSLRRSTSSDEQHTFRKQSQTLNYSAKIIQEPELNLRLTSSSAASGPICRICHERLGTLLRPCNCRGSMAYVHVECLQTWLTEKDINYCELCNYVFRVINVPEYTLIPSIGFWYKFAATNQQRKQILVDLTLAVILLPVLIFMNLFARSSTTEYPTVEFEDDGEYDESTFSIAWLLMIYGLRLFAFLLNLLYVGTVFVRINHHLAAWLSWYVNKNVTIILEDRRPHSVDRLEQTHQQPPL